MKQSLDENSIRELVIYRLQRSDETLKEAKLMLQEGFMNGAMNRLYYAAYYAVIALLLENGITAQTHAGVKQMLGLHFVLTGKLSVQTSNIYATLFEKRHSSDYDDFAFYDEEMLHALFPQVIEFVGEIKKLIQM